MNESEIDMLAPVRPGQTSESIRAVLDAEISCVSPKVRGELADLLARCDGDVLRLALEMERDNARERERVARLPKLTEAGRRKIADRRARRKDSGWFK